MGKWLASAKPAAKEKGMSAQPPFACLLIVDLQRQFVTPRIAPLVGRIQAVVGDYRTVVASRIVPEPGGLIERFKRWQPAHSDDPSSALAVNLSGLAAEAVRVVEKTGFNALDGPTVAWLQARGVTEVHLCGMDADLCVVRSTFAALEAGFRPVILRDFIDTSAGEPLLSHAKIQLKRIAGRGQVR